MMIESDQALITIADRGDLIAVRHQRAATAVIESVGLDVVLDTDHHHELDVSRRVALDVDEVEIRVAVGALAAELRHSFAVGWTTRLSVANTGPEPLTAIALVRLSLPESVTSWRVSTGAAGCVVLLPAAGPVLVGRVVNGFVDEVDDRGVVLQPTLSAGRRRVVTIRWDWFESPADLRAQLPTGLPRRSIARSGDVIAVPTSPDAALVLDGQARVEEEQEQVALVGGRGRARLESRSARGTTRTDLAWAEPEETVLDEAVEEYLSGPRTGAGVLRIDSLAAALVLQSRCQRVGLEDADTIAEALDLFTVRELDATADGCSAWRCCYLAGELARLAGSGRVDEDELLERARQSLVHAVSEARRNETLPPGLGLAAVRLGVAEVVRAGSAGAGVAAVAALTDEIQPDAVGAAGWWETRLATGPRSDTGPGSRRGRAEELLRGLGRRLGTGLPGAVARPLSTTEQAHLVAVLRLVPDEFATGLAADWGRTPAEVAEQGAAALALALASPSGGGPIEGPLGPAHAWLALVPVTD